MWQTTHSSQAEDTHPIDIVETLVVDHEWAFARTNDDRIEFVIDAQWRAYAVMLCWSGHDNTLRLACAFEMAPPHKALPALYDCLNRANDECWVGGFTYNETERMMVYRYALVCGAQARIDADQINQVIEAAISNAERFYPAFQQVCWGETPPAEALQVAIPTVHGHA